jgi:colanic acid/amylovoran biosynthesis glycosyltransferase
MRAQWTLQSASLAELASTMKDTVEDIAPSEEPPVRNAMSRAGPTYARVAYLVNVYPKVSHTFIRREVLALESQGINVTRIALRGWEDHLTDDEDHAERNRTRYVLKDGAWGLVAAIGRTLVGRPVALLRTLALAWRIGRRAERPLLVHLVYVAEACRILTWLETSEIGHLHAHFGTNPATIAMLVHSLGGPPWSFTVHGPDEFNNPQLIALAEKIRRCEFVVAISSFSRSQLYRLVEHRYWPKVKLVHCGLETGFHAVRNERAAEPRRLVCVGRLCEQKGQLLLIQAAARLAERGVEFQLVLAGDGEMRPEIETLISKLKLNDFIRITGWISSAEVRDEILSARAFVLASFAEGLPVSIMEAMSLRRPIISTFIAGIPELVVHGEHGWLVPAGDVEALAGAMQACLDAPADALERMGETARRRVLQHHDIDSTASLLIELFRGQSRKPSKTGT